MLRVCFGCRGVVPAQDKCTPSFALRDGALLFMKILRRLEIAESLITVSPSLLHPANDPLVDVIPDELSLYAGIRQTKADIEADEELARRMASDWEREERELLPMAGTTTGSSGSRQAPPVVTEAKAETTAESGDAFVGRRFGTEASPAAIPVSRVPDLIQQSSADRHPSRQIKGCGHACSDSSLPRCCACMDRREVRPENTYPAYVDGVGWTNTASRSAGYCPVCKT